MKDILRQSRELSLNGLICNSFPMAAHGESRFTSFNEWITHNRHSQSDFFLLKMSKRLYVCFFARSFIESLHKTKLFLEIFLLQRLRIEKWITPLSWVFIPVSLSKSQRGRIEPILNHLNNYTSINHTKMIINMNESEMLLKKGRSKNMTCAGNRA